MFDHGTVALCPVAYVYRSKRLQSKDGAKIFFVVS